MKYWLSIITLVLSLIFTSTSYAVLPVIDGAAIAQLASQLTTLKAQAADIKQQLDVLDGSQYQWSDAQSLINKLADNIQQSNTIAYSASDLDRRFSKLFPGYQPENDYQAKYQDITKTTLATINASLRSLGMNANDFEDENTRLKLLQGYSQNSKSQLQAIQASSQIASEQVSQLQLLRQTVMAQSSAQGAYYAAQTQKEAAAEANVQKILSNNNTDLAADNSGHDIWTPK